MLMHTVLRHRLVHLIACFAIMLNALAPAVSQTLVLVTGAPTGWTQICSIAGSRWVMPSADPAAKQGPASPASPAGAEQCPFCAVHAGSSGFAPAASLRFDAAVLEQEQPVVVAIVGAPGVAAYLHARGRAPPERV